MDAHARESSGRRSTASGPRAAPLSTTPTLEALPLIARRNRERGALLIVSDGSDTASTAGLREVNTALRRSQAFVYAIAIDPPDPKAINRSVNPTTLRQITDESGGRTEIVQSTADIAAASARIADELNHQYVVGYTPPHGADGKFHSIRVRSNGADYRVRARRGYVAEPGIPEYLIRCSADLQVRQTPAGLKACATTV